MISSKSVHAIAGIIPVRQSGITACESTMSQSTNDQPTSSSPSFDALAKRFADFVGAAPTGELKANAQQWFGARLRDLDLVTREEFDLQVKLLARANEKLTQLEAAVKALEAKP
jgi:ubiquinone biosynthesis accessory factor UbiK